MAILLEVIDKTKRRIYLTDERWKHILEHSEMQNKLEYIEDTLISPSKIISDRLENNIVYYYKYYKDITLKLKYLKIIAKYLNGKGFIVTAHFIDRIK